MAKYLFEKKLAKFELPDTIPGFKNEVNEPYKSLTEVSVLHLSVFLAGALSSDRYPLALHFRQIRIWSLLLGSRFISIVFICIVHENSLFYFLMDKDLYCGESKFQQSTKVLSFPSILL